MFGLNGISHWLILLALVLLIFGTGKLRHAGRDLGNAIAGFRKGLKDELPGETATPAPDRPAAGEKRQS
ncbi:MAG: Twin-arginine translocation protein TatA [Rhodanobacteraceae bacterium]|jgi:sec-independent protein translocase protein TatA|nr:MAG: Twin-arginine translocation protein TatA [Rhodanobacteraceae bacterium]